MTVKNEVELAVLTKEQAEALEIIKERGIFDRIVRERINDDCYVYDSGLSRVNYMSADKLMRAYYVGYTVEKTQEEREQALSDYYGNKASDSTRFGIEMALTFLGITIAGVND